MWLFLLTVYVCDAVPQGFGFAGGFSPVAITTNIRDVVEDAADLFTSADKITGRSCSHAQLVEILEVESQVVAGTNYRLKLRLQAKEGPGCRNTVEKICENIVVFKPLPNTCFGGNCLELSERNNIRCNTLNPLPPLAGGFSPVAITTKIRGVVNDAADLFGLENKITGDFCSHSQLLEILNVESQVVAGTNYKLKLRIQAKEGPGCRNEVEKICENIVVYKPLSNNCFGGSCLELIRQDEIRCDSLTPPPPPGPAPGGFSRLENIPQNVVILAQRATQELFHLENRISGSCGSKPQLVEVLEAASQVVAGTNYRLKLRMKIKEGQGCFTEVEKICDNITLNLPIPCFGGDCLGLIREDEIFCN